MKKIILILITSLIFSTQAFAAWTYLPTSPKVEQYGTGTLSYSITILFTSDGSASGNLYLENILSPDEWRKIAGTKLQSVSVSPGTGSVAPNAAYDVNVYDFNGTQTVDATTTSASSLHTYNTYDITGIIQQVLNRIKFDFGDIGDSGDQITIKFNFK